MIFGSFDMNKNIQNSYSYIINLEFKKANILLEKELLENPDNGFIPLYKNYIDFLTIIITEESNYFKSHHYLKKLRLKLLDKNDQDSPYYLYSKAGYLLTCHI